MARARKTRLTDVGIARLKPAAREYTVWDMRVPGLGVRVRPSGHRGYVYQCKVDGRAKRVTLGPAALRTVAEVRRECLQIEVQESRTGCQPRRQDADLRRLPSPVPWKSACFDRYKPRRERASALAENQLLPAFGVWPLDRIDRLTRPPLVPKYSRTARAAPTTRSTTFRRT